VTLPASVDAAAGSGAIGAACEVPETAAEANIATAIANTVTFIFVLLPREPAQFNSG
jgi:hypothetical protein